MAENKLNGNITHDREGGKVKGLKLLTKLGCTVPDYIVISFDQDITELSVQEQIKEFAGKVPFKTFAVRSSANIEDGEHSSFAGQFRSYLDVPPEQLIEKVSKVRESAQAEHVKNYCEAMGLLISDIKMNVIIQGFAKSYRGGVWMGNGINGGRLEWVEGGGEKVVNGDAIPYYESYDENGLLLSENTEKVLKDHDGQSVAALCLSIQKELMYEVDIEFCISQRGVEWLQLRRVTKNTGRIIARSNQLLKENILIGEPASSYTVKGTAYRLDQKNGDGWVPGQVLVARATSPNDMMYIMTSIGVVTKMGGMLSHAAVVCRELGKACAVGVDIDRITHGDEILVNGTDGEVHLL